MVNDNGANDGAGHQEDLIARHMEEFGLPACGDSTIFKGLMLKSLVSHYPEVDLSAIRIARELGFAHTLMMVSADELLRPAGLSWSKLFLLLWLRAKQDTEGKGLNPSELSGHLAVARNTVSTLLAGLERQGYITRELDPEDKRRFVIRLTPAGRNVVEECSTPLFSLLQMLVSALSREQRIALVQGLMEFQRAIIQAHADLAAGNQGS